MPEPFTAADFADRMRRAAEAAPPPASPAWWSLRGPTWST